MQNTITGSLSCILRIAGGYFSWCKDVCVCVYAFALCMYRDVKLYLMCAVCMLTWRIKEIKPCDVSYSEYYALNSSMKFFHQSLEHNIRNCTLSLWLHREFCSLFKQHTNKCTYIVSNNLKFTLKHLKRSCMFRTYYHPRGVYFVPC